MADKKLKCIWNMGTPCSDDVEERPLFQTQIKVPICLNHYKEHIEIIMLHKNKCDVEELLQRTPEDRRAEVLILQLSELDKSDVEP